jgi:hypothetical protein
MYSPYQGQLVANQAKRKPYPRPDDLAATWRCSSSSSFLVFWKSSSVTRPTVCFFNLSSILSTTPTNLSAVRSLCPSYLSGLPWWSTKISTDFKNSFTLSLVLGLSFISVISWGSTYRFAFSFSLIYELFLTFLWWTCHLARYLMLVWHWTRMHRNAFWNTFCNCFRWMIVLVVTRINHLCLITVTLTKWSSTPSNRSLWSHHYTEEKSTNSIAMATKVAQKRVCDLIFLSPSQPSWQYSSRR